MTGSIYIPTPRSHSDGSVDDILKRLEDAKIAASIRIATNKLELEEIEAGNRQVDKNYEDMQDRYAKRNLYVADMQMNILENIEELTKKVAMFAMLMVVCIIMVIIDVDVSVKIQLVLK